MFGKKQEVEKPSKIKIDMAFENCQESIQELLDDYEVQKEGYFNKIIACKKSGDVDGAELYTERLKEVMMRYKEMANLLAEVDSFKNEINGMFKKIEVEKTLATVGQEVSKMTVDKEMKKIAASFGDFSKHFQDTMNIFNVTMNKVTGTMSKIDNKTSKKFDKSIEASVDKEIARLNETVLNVDNDIDNIDKMKEAL